MRVGREDLVAHRVGARPPAPGAAGSPPRRSGRRWSPGPPSRCRPPRRRRRRPRPARSSTGSLKVRVTRPGAAAMRESGCGRRGDEHGVPQRRRRWRRGARRRQRGRAPSAARRGAWPPGLAGARSGGGSVPPIRAARDVRHPSRRAGGPGCRSCSRERPAWSSGVANKRSIAWAIARKLDAAGARLALTYQNERTEGDVRKLADDARGLRGRAAARRAGRRPGGRRPWPAPPRRSAASTPWCTRWPSRGRRTSAGASWTPAARASTWRSTSRPTRSPPSPARPSRTCARAAAARS